MNEKLVANKLSDLNPVILGDKYVAVPARDYGIGLWWDAQTRRYIISLLDGPPGPGITTFADLGSYKLQREAIAALRETYASINNKTR